jgi:hypothetical protein
MLDCLDTSPYRFIIGITSRATNVRAACNQGRSVNYKRPLGPKWGKQMNQVADELNRRGSKNPLTTILPYSIRPVNRLLEILTIFIRFP